MSSLCSSSEAGPFTLIATPKFETGKDDQYTVCATEMALVHNCFIRGFNSIYTHAFSVQPHEYKAFLSYAHACYLCLEAHHTAEETIAFPSIEQATGVKGLIDIISFLNSKRPIGEFSGQHLRKLIEAFAEPLNQHLHDEIPTLLALAKYGDELDLAGIFEKETQEIVAKLSKTAIMLAFLLNNDVTFEGGIHNFPPIPGLVKWLLMRVFTLWYWRWWSWTSCDKSGKLKVLKGEKA